MQARTSRAVSRRPAPNPARLIRELCAERAMLQEEIRQLRAAVQIFRELARRADRPKAG